VKHVLSAGFPTPTLWRGPELRAILKAILRIAPAGFSTSKMSQFYDILPSIATGYVWDRGMRERVRELVLACQNGDGSFGGLTHGTIKMAYILRELGNEAEFRKALKWLDEVRNDNGSLKPLQNQDVYDTVWGVLSCADEDHIDESFRWFERLRIGGGFPYYSGGYYPDVDDTALVLMAKNRHGIPLDQAAMAFLLSSQNPDGGWGFLPFYSLKYYLPYRWLMKESAFLHSVVTRKGLSWFWNPSADSTVDMTARVLVTLTRIKSSDRSTRDATRRGVRYLLNSYVNNEFHNSSCWTYSHTYEDSLALIALATNGIRYPFMRGVLESHSENLNAGGDELAHVIWASIELGLDREIVSRLVARLIHLQNPEGSWSPMIDFRLTVPYRDPMASTAFPLFALNGASEYLRR